MNLELLEELALKATGGTWISGFGDTKQIGYSFGVGVNTTPDWTPVAILSLPSDVNEQDVDNGKYLEAVQPSNILAIIQYIKHMQSVIEAKDKALHNVVKFDNYCRDFEDGNAAEVHEMYELMIEQSNNAIKLKEI